jgi:hypothetical protein
MDHKVSKDMISSGMIPSGEKTQADLGRTQYGSAPSPSSLMDAYKSIYEHHQKDKDGNTIPHEGEQLNEGKMPEGLKNYLMKKKGKKEDKKDMKEEGAVTTTKMMGDIKYQVDEIPKTKSTPQKPESKSVPQKKLESKPVPQMNDVDLFDLVKGRLIDEGVDEKEALKIMVNATEEQLQQIVEMDKMGGPAAIAGIMGAGILGAKKMVQGVNNMRKNLQQKTQQKNKAIEQM